jgi:hypothetical protein
MIRLRVVLHPWPEVAARCVLAALLMAIGVLAVTVQGG